MKTLNKQMLCNVTYQVYKFSCDITAHQHKAFTLGRFKDYVTATVHLNKLSKEGFWLKILNKPTICNYKKKRR